MPFPDAVTRKLADDMYRRGDRVAVQRALAELGTPVPADFREFYETYQGAFGSQQTGFELRDLCEDRENVVGDTRKCRELYAWPNRFLVLTDFLESVLVLDASSGHVYDVDFEGGDQELLWGTLEPSYRSFSEFLAFYFSDRP